MALITEFNTVSCSVTQPNQGKVLLHCFQQVVSFLPTYTVQRIYSSVTPREGGGGLSLNQSSNPVQGAGSQSPVVH